MENIAIRNGLPPECRYICRKNNERKNEIDVRQSYRQCFEKRKSIHEKRWQRGQVFKFFGDDQKHQGQRQLSRKIAARNISHLPGIIHHDARLTVVDRTMRVCALRKGQLVQNKSQSPPIMHFPYPLIPSAIGNARWAFRRHAGSTTTGCGPCRRACQRKL